jgi:6,7-dimethyl-8-ribityllumazine synthase
MKKKRILIVLANYYKEISDNLYNGAINKLTKSNTTYFTKYNVPGIFEIPVLISKNIKSYDGFIALGCVIKGKTPHFDYISRATIYAIMNLSITYNKPIGNGIITCLNKKQAYERSYINKKNKGGEAASAVLSVLNNLNKKYGR